MDEKSVVPATEDSSIDHINNAITNSDGQNESPAAVEEEHADTVEEKPAQKPQAERKTPAPAAKRPSKTPARASTKAPAMEKKQPLMKATTKSTPPAKTRRHIPTPARNKSGEKKTSERNTPMKERPEKKSMKAHKQKTQKSLLWLWIVLAVILVAAIIILAIQLQKPKSVSNKTENPVAATVNGEPIYAARIEQRFNGLNPFLKTLYTRAFILNQTINEVLLTQEAKNEGIVITDLDITDAIDGIKKSNGLTDQQFNDAIAKQNLTMDDVKTLITNQLLITRLINQTVLPLNNVTADEMRAYYENNKTAYTLPEEVTVQHILILIKDNVTDAIAKSQIDAVAAKLNATNFCDLVAEYTEDTGSKNTCGVYTFKRGVMVPEFENASFDMNINETRTVKTVYGWHLIKKLNMTPETVQPFEEVAQEVNKTLNDAQTQVNFDNFIAQLRAKANISIYMYNDDNTTNTTTTTPVDTQAVRVENLAKCITGKGAVFYGASWCAHCANQKQIFGDAMKFVHYVECADANNPQVQTEECNTAGITGYPTWIINNQSYAGEQSLEQLAQLTGCTY